MRIIAACLLLLCTTTLAAAAPNIVVILTDDQDDTGSMNYMPKTLSLLAEHGITFTNSFVNFSLCAPSRSSFLTGEAAHNDGITSNKGTKGGGWTSFKKDEENVLPVWLKAAGYKTALLGKYVNGYAKGKRPHGFGYWASVAGSWLDLSSIPANPATYVPPSWDLWYALTKERYYDYSVNENGTLINFGHEASDYATDVVKDRAVRFIKDQAGSTAPFFMLVATKAPHGQGDEGEKGPAIAARGEHAFMDVTIPRNPAFYESDVTDKEPSFRQTPVVVGRRGNLETEYRKELQSLQSVDDLVEAVVTTLRDTGKLDNTLIVYTSDDGIPLRPARAVGKASPYEGSIRFPLVIRRTRGAGEPEAQPAREQSRHRGHDWRTLPGRSQASLATATRLSRSSPTPTPRGVVPSSSRVATTEAPRPNAMPLFVRRTGIRRMNSGFEELYDLAADPYELASKVHDAKYTGDLARMRGMEQKLRTCAGPDCWI